MARRSVFICDGKGCGTVLLEAHDGFLIKGTITESVVENPKALVGDALTAAALATGSLPEETALCAKCMIQLLGLSK
jgi:hypothetical protein